MTIYNLNASKNGKWRPRHQQLDSQRTYDSYGLQLSARLPYGATLFGGLGFDSIASETPAMNRMTRTSSASATTPTWTRTFPQARRREGTESRTRPRASCQVRYCSQPAFR